MQITYQDVNGQVITEPTDFCYQIITDTKSGSVTKRAYSKSENEIPTIQLVNVSVSGEGVQHGNGDIWWLPKGAEFSVFAVADGLPDGQFIVMVERVVNGEQVVDDVRLLAQVKDGAITMKGRFELSGNYVIRKERLNSGLNSISAGFKLAFDKIEFDAYV